MLEPEFSGSGSCLDSGCASVELLVVGPVLDLNIDICDVAVGFQQVLRGFRGHVTDCSCSRLVFFSSSLLLFTSSFSSFSC